MPGGRKAKSKRQARFLGAVASGKAKGSHAGLSAKEAKDMLRGVKVKKLPAKAKKKRA